MEQKKVIQRKTGRDLYTSFSWYNIIKWFKEYKGKGYKPAPLDGTDFITKASDYVDNLFQELVTSNFTVQK